MNEVLDLVPGADVTTIDLFSENLPEFGKDAAEAKFAPIFGQETTSEQDTAWQQVLKEIERFDSGKKILLSTPMWNYSIPYKLKHYLDLIMQPRVTFSYNRETMQHYGLLRNRPLQLILTRSSVLPGDFMDFQLPYLKFAFDCMGIRDVSVLSAWHTTQTTSEERQAYLSSIEPDVLAAARAFAMKSA